MILRTVVVFFAVQYSIILFYINPWIQIVSQTPTCHLFPIFLYTLFTSPKNLKYLQGSLGECVLSFLYSIVPRNCTNGTVSSNQDDRNCRNRAVPCQEVHPTLWHFCHLRGPQPSSLNITQTVRYKHPPTRQYSDEARSLEPWNTFF